MNKIVKIIIIFLVIDAVVIGGYLGYKTLFKQKGETGLTQDYQWITMDQDYTPENVVEEFIMKDSLKKGIFPVSVKNYDKNTAILDKFRGRNFAGPKESQLNMMYHGLEDWMLVDIKYKKKEREVIRTVLYIMVNGEWRVGDSGTLAQ
ncbi:MAG: hypothetical protein ACLFVG_01235 [Candidatus Aminicenantes bacterium]